MKKSYIHILESLALSCAIQAVSYKDRGNERIATGDSAGALKHYERGIKIASRLSADEQARCLLVSLRLNLALACTKEERYIDAAAAASKVLEVDHANVKVSSCSARSMCFADRSTGSSALRSLLDTECPPASRQRW